MFPRGENWSTLESLEQPSAQHRLLIVAPHIDDETIGAGGLAVDTVRSGGEVFVIFLTAGDSALLSARLLCRTVRPTTAQFLSVGHTRIAEAHAAMRLLGIPRDHYFFLGYPDRGLRSLAEDPSAVVPSTSTGLDRVCYAEAHSPGALYTGSNLLHDVMELIKRIRPTHVAAPVDFDLHPDHSAAAAIVEVALRALSFAPMRLGYVVHSVGRSRGFLPARSRSIVPPQHPAKSGWVTYPVCAETLAVKENMLNTYRSQGPYTFLLRHLFIRRNELFYVGRPENAEWGAVLSLACASSLSFSH